MGTNAVSTGESKESRQKEAVFQKRLAELQAERNQFPWNISNLPEFDIPKEQSKLFADRSIEDPGLSDDEIERRALLDLTSYNFWTFYKRLNYEVRRARRYKRDLSLILAAIDNLQEVSRLSGLGAENAIVLSAGRLLLESIRDVDIAGRCRDDTFGIILPETQIEGAEVAAQRLLTKMESHTIWHDGQSFAITISIGGTTVGAKDEQLELVVARSIEALRNCMESGGNRVSLV